MTPNHRLDQLEPLMADSLQKIDRLIEGQGQIVQIATRTDQNADTAARGGANLTISTQRQFDELRANQERFLTSQEALEANQNRFLTSHEESKINQDRLLANYEELKTKQEEFKIGQDLILQILRKKLL